jgi:hypothetical protein
MRCTVCLGTSAHRPCFDLSVCLQPVCLSPVCPSDWLANPIACASLPASPSLFVDGLDSKFWYRSGCRAAALASGSTLAVGSLSAAFHHAERAPSATSSLTAESPQSEASNHPWCRYRDCQNEEMLNCLTFYLDERCTHSYTL